MRIECMEESCEQEEEFQTKAEATEQGWRWDEFMVDGEMYRYGYCREHKEDNSIPHFGGEYDPENDEDIEKMKKMFNHVQNSTPVSKPVTDSTGSKSRSLDQF